MRWIVVQHQQNWNNACNNKQFTMHNKYTNDDVDFDDCVAHKMHWDCTYGSSSERMYVSIHGHSHGRMFLVRFLFFFSTSFFFVTVFSFCILSYILSSTTQSSTHSFLSQVRSPIFWPTASPVHVHKFGFFIDEQRQMIIAEVGEKIGQREFQAVVLWVRQPDRHGKFVLFHQQGGGGCQWRLHFLDRFWAQTPDFRWGQRLFSPFLLRDPFHGQGRGWRDTRQGTHTGTPRTSELEGVSVSQLSSFFVFDGSGQLDGKRNADQSINFGVTRNTYSVHSNFSENTQVENMVDRTGKPDERNSWNAQIRTLLDEQRQMIIAEYFEKIGHHEFQAAHAEEERRVLQGELWRQQMDFREVHQHSFTEMEELRKFQSSIIDAVARQKLIQDQNTILELSGRLKELQIEVNCMNDSKDFQDAESVHSGNSHVTSRPVFYPSHPIFWREVEAFFRIAALQRRAAMHLGYTWNIWKRFCKSTCFLFSSLSSRIESMEDNHWGTASYICSGEKCKARTESRSEMPVWTVSLKFSHLQWRRLFQELWDRPTSITDFRSPFWQVP